MVNTDIIKHIKGKSQFIDDIPVPNGTLYASVFVSSLAHAKIKDYDLSDALNFDGVERIISAKDIPGLNQIGGIIQDEQLLAEDEVHYIGQPIFIIIAKNTKSAKLAKRLIKINYEELEVVTDELKAYQKKSFIMPPKTFESGNIKEAWGKCHTIVKGSFSSGGQEHLYLETQGSLAIPTEDKKVKIISSTQSPTTVQKTIANVLNIPMNLVEVDVLRLGGGFGGKEDQATPWAVMTALGTFLTGKPVKLILSRHDDLYMTGKRHPYTSFYKIGVDKNFKIIAYEVKFLQNAGAAADLSPAILERTLFHATNAYFIPNVKATAYCCKTNLPPNTAFRGFGGPQGKFVIESALNKIASKLNVKTSIIQKKNLISSNNYFYYGQKASNSKARDTWNKAEKYFDFRKLINSVEKFNETNNLHKQGLAIMPICFGISFTSSFLNQASALIHIYRDGSVGVSTAAVEMGQGVNEKIKNIIAKTLSIPNDYIKIESTNTTRIANTSATAASSGADLNGNAAIIACKNILTRLFEFISYKYDIGKNTIKIDNGIIKSNNKKLCEWKDLINNAYLNRINLSSHAYYSTPKIYFDRKINKGNPFAYHVYGTSITKVTVDCLRGTYNINFVKVVHDFGKSINHLIDLGQAEGGIVQGIGWVTLEEVKYNDEGKLLSNSLSTYKVPDIYSIPQEINVKFLDDSKNRFGPLKSKAIGEPPLMYGIGTYFAILNAIKAFNKNADLEIPSPITPERVLLNLYTKNKI